MNILAVSMAYPPLAYPRSIQVARLLKHAAAAAVLFCADEPGARTDQTIEPDAESRLHACFRITVRRSLISRNTDLLLHRFYRRAWNRRNLVPDAYGLWKKDVLTSTGSYLKSSGFRPDAIVTFAQPFTDHLIGLQLKKTLGIPWFAHFSDPWADNPFTAFDDETRKLNADLERSVVETADILAFTSMETVDLFCEKYPESVRKKSRVLPQCYDADQFIERALEDRITLRYLGNFYGRRTPKSLIAALKMIDQRNANVLDGVTVELVGSGDADEVRRLSDGLRAGVLTVRESVGYAESLKMMSSSDGLLVIDAPAEKSVFLPSKLIDYIGAGRPVFGITPAGTAAKLIDELGGLVADPGDQNAVADRLEKFLSQLRKRRSEKCPQAWGSPAVRERFTASRVSSDFDRLLDELVG